MLGTLLRISLPLSAAQFAQSMMLLTDTVLMGLLGVDALAGGALAVGAFQFFFYAMGGILFATPNVVAVAMGKGRLAEVIRNLRAGLWVAVLLAIVLALLCLGLPRLFELLGYDALIRQAAADYLKGAFWIGWPAFAFLVFRGLAAGLAQTRMIMTLTVSAAILNVPVSYVLAIGVGAWKGLGLEGIALGTAVVHLYLLLATLRALKAHRVARRCLRHLRVTPQKADFRPFGSLGVPIGLAIGLEMGLFFAAALLVGRLGALALAAHQIALQAASASFNLYIGLAQGTAIRVGQLWGQGESIRADKAARTGFMLGMAVCVMVALIFISVPDWIIRAFSLNATPREQAALLQTGIGLFWVAALFQLADGAQVIIINVLRALHLGAGPTVATAVGYWLIGMPVAWWLGTLLGVQGVWLGLGAGLLATSMMLGALYWRALGRHVPPRTSVI